jgi:hypothetical protein
MRLDLLKALNEERAARRAAILSCRVSAWTGNSIPVSIFGA